MTAIKLKYRIEYFFFYLFNLTCNLFPRNIALKLGSMVGSLARLILVKRKKIARENIKRAFPSISKKEINTIIRESFSIYGKNAVELFRLDRYNKNSYQNFVQIEGEDKLEKLLFDGKGAFILTGHIGCWEAGAYVFPFLGFSIDFMGKRIKNPLVNDFVISKRTCNNAGFIDRKKSMRKILSSLKNNNAIAILLDQHVSPKEAIKVPFFNESAFTSPVIANLSIKKNIPIIPVFAIWEGNKIKVIFKDPVQLLEGLPEEVEVENTTRLNRCIEEIIKAYPNQWMWIHKRWRT